MAKGLKKLFKTWREKGRNAPFILFLDEFDSIGGRGNNGNNESWFRTIVDSWLAFLDGAEPRTGVICVAATNFPDTLDYALRRPGRLDRHIIIPDPTIDDMIGIIAHHLGAQASSDALRRAAVACRGRSPADVAQACREARRISRRARRPVTPADVVQVARASAPKKTPEQWKQTALHEAGHAVAASTLGLTVHYADLDSPRGAHVRWERYTGMLTREGVGRLLSACLAGRAADELHGIRGTCWRCTRPGRRYRHRPPSGLTVGPVRFVGPLRRFHGG